jgi:hypothetical protein
MLKLNEKMYLWVYASKYDGAQTFITMNRKALEESTTDLSDWECFEIESIPTAKMVKVTKQPSKIEYL